MQTNPDFVITGEALEADTLVVGQAKEIYPGNKRQVLPYFDFSVLIGKRLISDLQ